MASSITRKKVFLFGAGAVIDWAGPRTICDREKLTMLPDHLPPHEKSNRVCCLTHLLLETGFENKHGEKVSASIFKNLQQRGISKDRLNFETIISFVEDLFSYYANEPEKRLGILGDQSPSEWIKDLFHFKTEPVGKGLYHYSFTIPGREFPHEHGVKVGTPPEQLFCKFLFHEMLSGIVGHVSKYSYWSNTRDNIVVNATNEKLNHAFILWMQSFVNLDYSLRMYTLNYDSIFRHLLEQVDVEVFDGFEKADSGFEERGLHVPDPGGILSNDNGHIHYNLHGCSDWRVEDINDSGMPSYQYFRSGAPHIESSEAVVEFEKGRRLLLSNIISGYQKVQRTYVTPFRQMLASFDHDCLEAEEIFLIGYSYADEHINEIIRNAKKYKPDIKITVINPTFNNDQFMVDFLLHWGHPVQFIYEKVGDEVIASQYNFKGIAKTFGEFLLSNLKV